MKSFRLAQFFSKTTFIILFSLLISLNSVAQNRPLEPIIPLPDMNGEVQPLSLEDSNIIYPPFIHPSSEIVSSEEVTTSVLQPFDFQSRLENVNSLPNGATFYVDYLGDTSSNDITLGDGICGDIYGTCGLRTAIQESNALPGADTIILPVGFIRLSILGDEEDAALSGDLDIKDSVTIQGAGAKYSYITNSSDRVFHMINPSSNEYITVNFVDVSMSDGNAKDVNGAMDISVVGGGILSECGVDLLLNRVNLYNNSSWRGGGIFIKGDGCTPNFPITTIHNSSIYQNSTPGGVAPTGAAIDMDNGGTLTIINSTIADNFANSNYLDTSAGIRIGSNPNNQVFIQHTTIARNVMSYETEQGKGLYIGEMAHVELKDNLIALNTIRYDNTSSADCAGLGGTSLGGNIFGSATCPMNSGDMVVPVSSLHDLVSEKLFFHAPSNTPTLSVNTTSEAHNFIEQCSISQDQRGIERPLNYCSSGAYQYVNSSALEPGSFLVLSPAGPTIYIPRFATWQIPANTVLDTNDVTLYDVTLYSEAQEIFTLTNLTADSDSDPLVCTVRTTESKCVLTFTRLQRRLLEALKTYRLEVRAHNSVGSNTAHVNFETDWTFDQFVNNGDFELDSDNNNIPDNWISERRRGDRRLCNTETSMVTPFGNCAYYMIGRDNKNSILQQTTNFPIWAGDKKDFYFSPTRDTIFLLEGFVRANGSIKNANITFTVNYSDGRRQSMVIPLRKTSGYQPLTFFVASPQLRVKWYGATSISLSLINRSSRGRIYVDNLRLRVFTYDQYIILP